MARSRSLFSFQTPLGILVVALCLSGCLALAAALRLENPQSLSLCHFEEGVHSASAQRLLTAGATNLDYAQPLHAPPLFPWTVAALGLAKPSSPRDGIFVSIVCGALTPLAMFIVGWRLNGIGFGLAAAALLACSDLHIAVSRTGLPSAMLTLWSTLALWAAMEWAPRPLPRGATPLLSRYVFFGMLGGALLALAWSTMYSGGLGLLIIAISLGLSWRLEAEEFEDRGPYVFIAFCLAAAIALSAFVPWYLHLQADFPGGFWGVLEHHRRQITGWRHWPEHLGRQLTALPGLRHHGWWLGVALVTCVGLVLAWRETGWRRTMAIALAVTAASLAVTAGVDALVLVCGVAGAGPALLSRRWPLVLCAVWLLMFTLLVPLHFPYVKLLTPMLPSAILLCLMLIWPSPVAVAASDERLAHQWRFAPRRETP
ncbi:MAG: hypothetical protein KDB14_22145, partial [Planctomycetales bacterium]|nr:hypothetical protein [Planctomycetales bacterium]